MDSLVSVVIPVYNCALLVQRCVRSYLNQGYDNLEIIVVDDGSTDETVSKLEELKGNDKRLHIISQSHQGVSSARNRGIEAARGIYIFFADADDYTEDGFIEECVKLHKNFEVELVISGYYFDITDQAGSFMQMENRYKNMVLVSKKEVKAEFTSLWDSAMMYNTWNKMFILDILRIHEIRFPVGKEFNEDRDFVRDYLKHISSIAISKKCFYHYNRSDATATGIYRSNLYDIRKEEYLRLKEFFDEYGVKDSASREYLAREQADRVMGCVENMFHDKDRSKSKIKQQIREILDDPLTSYVFRLSKPKSKKMKILFIPYRMNWVGGIYSSMAIIYKIKMKYPKLFHRLKQSR